MMNQALLMGLSGVSQEQVEALKRVTGNIRAGFTIHDNGMEIRFSAADRQAGQYILGMMESLAQQFAETMYTYLGIQGSLKRVRGSRLP